MLSDRLIRKILEVFGPEAGGDFIHWFEGGRNTAWHDSAEGYTST